MTDNLDIENQFWDQVAKLIPEHEFVYEVVAKAKKLKNQIAPHLTALDVEDEVCEMWNEYWSKYL